MHTKFKVSSFKRCKDYEKFVKFESKSRDLDYVPFWLTFLLMFYSIQSVYTLNKKPVALAVSELFTVVYSLKYSQVT